MHIGYTYISNILWTRRSYWIIDTLYCRTPSLLSAPYLRDIRVSQGPIWKVLSLARHLFLRGKTQSAPRNVRWYRLLSNSNDVDLSPDLQQIYRPHYLCLLRQSCLTCQSCMPFSIQCKHSQSGCSLLWGEYLSWCNAFFCVCSSGMTLATHTRNELGWFCSDRKLAPWCLGAHFQELAQWRRARVIMLTLDSLATTS